MKTAIKAAGLIVTAILLLAFALVIQSTPAHAQVAQPGEPAHLPPRFLPGAAFYKADRLVNVQFGKQMHLSLSECMEDVRHTVQKATPLLDEGNRVIGFCVPIPTYSVADLAPAPGTDI